MKLVNSSTYQTATPIIMSFVIPCSLCPVVVSFRVTDNWFTWHLNSIFVDTMPWCLTFTLTVLVCGFIIKCQVQPNDINWFYKSCIFSSVSFCFWFPLVLDKLTWRPINFLTHLFFYFHYMFHLYLFHLWGIYCIDLSVIHIFNQYVLVYLFNLTPTSLQSVPLPLRTLLSEKFIS